jgi:hypothetical protein
VLSEAEIAAAAARLPPACRVADAPSAEARGDLEVLRAAPVELSADALVVCAANGSLTRVEYTEIDAVSVVEVSELASDPIALIDLVLSRSHQGQGPARVIRLRSDGFDPAALVPHACGAGGELAAFLGELLERSRAIPLPDPESALGLRLAVFQSLEDYESEVLLAR